MSLALHKSDSWWHRPGVRSKTSGGAWRPAAASDDPEATQTLLSQFLWVDRCRSRILCEDAANSSHQSLSFTLTSSVPLVLSVSHFVSVLCSTSSLPCRLLCPSLTLCISSCLSFPLSVRIIKPPSSTFLYFTISFCTFFLHNSCDWAHAPTATRYTHPPTHIHKHTRTHTLTFYQGSVRVQKGEALNCVLIKFWKWPISNSC